MGFERYELCCRVCEYLPVGGGIDYDMICGFSGVDQVGSEVTKT